jgi:MoaA/NifB/PqqE/SkfB family radical SAM enzyme
MRPLPLHSFLPAITGRRLVNGAAVFTSLAYSILRGRAWCRGKPVVLTIEPTNHCDLNCPHCDTGASRSSRRRGFIDLALYEKILIESHDHVVYILLYDQGEPLLHPRLAQMIRMAKLHRFVVACSTNGQRLAEPGVAESLIASGLDLLIVSADGLTQESFSHYRRGGDLEKLQTGLQNIRTRRRKTGTRYPRLALQFVVMKHNEKELPRLKTTARAWGADEVLIKSAYFSTAGDAAAWMPANETFRRYRIDRNQLIRKGRQKGPCRRCWYSAVVHWDGSVVPCCFDKNDSLIMGRMPQKWQSIWTDSSYEKLRNSFSSSRPDICRNCTDGIKIYHT